MTSCSGFVLPSNPDISGVGVRSAVYLQSFLSIIPMMLTTIDGKIVHEELNFIQGQAISAAILSLSILVAAIVQATTLGMTAYHAHIALIMASLNLTTGLAFVYFHLQTRVMRTRRLQVPLMIALCFILTGATGLWLWSSPYSFSKTGNIQEIECVIVRIPMFLLKGHFSTKWLRGLSLYSYAILLLPGVPLFIATAAAAYMECCCGTDDSDNDLDDTEEQSPEVMMLYIIITLVVCITFLIMNAFSILAIELTINANRHLQNSDEAVWSFGQTLALLVLAVPIWDAIKLLWVNVKAAMT